MKQADQVVEVMELIAEPGTSGSRSEWLYHFEITQATNCPVLLFADAHRAKILIEKTPGTYCFVAPEPTANPLDTLVSVSRLQGFYIDTKTGEKKPGQGVFNKGVFDHMPLRSAINLIRTDHFRPRTEAYRANPTKKFKDTQFCYATFSGTFHYANDSEENRITHSGMICIDLDKLANPQKSREIISALPGYVFSFISPSGTGLKAVFLVDLKLYSQKEWYTRLSWLVTNRCGLPFTVADRSCYNYSRACYLCFDASVHVNPSFL